MVDAGTSLIEELVQRRPAPQRSILRKLFGALYASTAVKAAFLHGSLARTSDDHLSDVDLIVVADSCDISTVDEIVTVATCADSAPEFDFVDHSYPWFGRLRCLQWTVPQLQVDLGLVLPENLRAFFVEPTALVLRDWHGVVEGMRRETRERREASVRDAVLTAEGKMFSGLRKIHKSLVRGHLWNAVDAVSQMRRLLFGLLLAELDPLVAHRVGRQDRDIESFLPADLAAEIASTATIYSIDSISRATEKILDIAASRDPVRKSWRSLDDLRSVVDEIRLARGGA